MSLLFPQPTAIPRAAQGSLYGAAPRTAAGMPARPAASAYATQAARYREAELSSASPGQLVVMLFDKILLTLRRARLAAEARQIEDRVEQLLKANEMITELRISLDFEQGGAISQNLDALYAFSLRQLFEASRSGDVTKIDGVSRIMGELRDAFAQVVNGMAAPAAPAPAASAVRSA
jgi:flagellar protein FliS